MDGFSNLERGASNAMTTSSGAGTAAALAPEKKSDPFQFPGEDGGRSLTAWARRDLEATLQLLADRAQYITGGSGAAIALRDGEHIICRASSGPSAPEVGSYLQVSSGLSGESVRTRKILSCDNAAADPRVNRDSCRALGIASFVVMPLVRENDAVGIFEIFSGQPYAFQDRDIQALERLGEMVITALDQVTSPKAKPVFAGMDTQKIRVQMNAAKPAGDTAEPPKAPEVPAMPTPVAASAAPAQPAEVVAQPVVETNDGGTPDAAPKIAVSVGTCASCGFPVSPGRAFCLDCEAALPEKFNAGAAAKTPAFLTDLAEGPPPSGIKQWLIVHRYLLGTILVLGGTAALLLLR